MDTLRHNGILVLQPPTAHGLSIVARKKRVELDQYQEEMAVAWVKKLGTQYAEDPIFQQNFMKDFSDALGISPPLTVDEVDFSEVISLVESERARKEAMTSAEKKEAREARKAQREALKEEFGYVEVDGERMELSSYMTEPSGIFMGRGEHPLRGRWKSGAKHEDITLNMSPDQEAPEGNWHEIVWEPECLWIAKWTDELTGKTKYIWLHDSTPIKQEREEAKFNRAINLEKKLDSIRTHIMEGLRSDDSKTREVAAACYLIDRLSLRVGDEKDKDEADTVGATTLRIEHVTFNQNSVVFDFLGKDSVRWHKEMTMPSDVYVVFEELYNRAVERVDSFKKRTSKRTSGDQKKLAQIFPKVRSTDVNQFLSQVHPHLTAKVFRTFHATKIMRDTLAESKVKKSEPDFVKKAAVKRANMEVARVMNHTKQAPKGWSKRAKRFEERIKKAEKRIGKAKRVVEDKKKRLRNRRKREKKTLENRKTILKRQEDTVEKRKEMVEKYRVQRNRAKEVWDNARAKKSQVRESRRKGKRTKKERLEESQAAIDRARERLDKAEENLTQARERYAKSREILEKKKANLTQWRKKSSERIERSKRTLQRAKESLKKAEDAKRKIETDYALSREGRELNLGTSLKSYVHPRIVYRWCQRVEYDWRKIYTKALQKKFDWVEN